MTTEYLRVTGLADLFARARELSVSTMILDVEPLVAPWRSSQEALDGGIARILGDIRTVPSVNGRGLRGAVAVLDRIHVGQDHQRVRGQPRRTPPLMAETSTPPGSFIRQAPAAASAAGAGVHPR